MNAVLIMCHKNIEQVIRFATRCHTDNTDIIIHCDSTMCDIEYSQICEFIESIKSGYYLTLQRFHGELDTRSLVDIAMEMVNTAYIIQKNENKHYDYFLLCSGQDYLIKPMPVIEKELKKVYPKPYIDCTPYFKKNWVWYKFHTNKNVIQIKNWITQNIKKGVIRIGMRLIECCLFKITRVFNLVPYNTCEKRGLNLFGGSAWWILPDKIMDYILVQYNSQENEIVDILLNQTYTPEETFFQIMAMQSPYKDMIEVNPKDMKTQNCKTWAYFSDDEKIFQGHPYIFTINEFEKIQKSDCWFARKFDLNIDSQILDRIDHEILNVH